MQSKKNIGILALQGGFLKHIEILKKLNVEFTEVRLKSDLLGCDGLIIPGGESTAIIKLMLSYDLIDPIKKFAENHSVFGTCAGSIIMAKTASNFNYPTLNLIDLEVDRNAYGRQIDSFFAELDFADTKLSCMFIRAPKFSHLGKSVRALAIYNKDVVIAENDQHLVATCHPELAEEVKLHEYWLKKFVIN
jgi:5'-phosphate synthase pdxT subunit